MGLKILLKDSKIPIFYDRAGIINKKYIDTEKKNFDLCYLVSLLCFQNVKSYLKGWNSKI